MEPGKILCDSGRAAVAPVVKRQCLAVTLKVHLHRDDADLPASTDAPA